MVCKSCVKFWLFGVILASVISWIASIFVNAWIGIGIGLLLSNGVALLMFDDKLKQKGGRR